MNYGEERGFYKVLIFQLQFGAKKEALVGQKNLDSTLCLLETQLLKLLWLTLPHE